MIANQVVIVGAGLAGLYAAYLLEQQNIPYTLLEAQSRPGGRILGVASEQVAEHHFDLGPTWIFPHQSKIQTLCKQLKLNLFKQYSKGDVLYQRSAQQRPQQMAGAGELELFKIQGGSQALISTLFNKLNKNSIRFEHMLTDIERLEDSWQLTTSCQGDEHKMSVDKLILAMPPRLIAPYLFNKKWISKELVQNLQSSQTWMAGQAKFVASYTNAFWREKGLSGQMFSQVGPLVETHDASTDEEQNPALFGFIGWPATLRTQITEQQLKDACLAQLVSCFGSDAQAFNGCYVKDWATDTHIATAQDKIEPSRHPDIDLSPHFDELRRLGLYMVASEFASTDPGYLEGAIDAASLGVQAILKHTSRDR